MVKMLILARSLPLARDVERMVTAHPDWIVAGVAAGKKESLILLDATRPDLVLLDTSLGDTDSFELLQSFPFIPFHLIFFSDTNEHAIRAFRSGALDYLLLPVKPGELGEALEKALVGREYRAEHIRLLERAQEEEFRNNRIVLRTQHYMAVASFPEIVYCEASGGYTTFHLQGGRQELVTRSIRVYEEMLPVSWFVRTHQSYLVNYRLIERYHKDGYVVMRSGARIPVATRKKDHLIRLIAGTG